MNTSPSPNAKLWAGFALTAIMIPAYILMRKWEIDDAGLLGLVSPLIMYLILGAKVDKVTAEQNEVLAKIDEQTNGILDKRIKKIVNEALDTKLADVTVTESADSPQNTQQELF